jgi:hypothetical protein
MPAEDGIGSEKSADLIEEFAAEDFPFDGQAAALVVVQQDATFADYFPEYLIFRSQVIVDLLLPVVDPAGEDEMEQMPRFKNEANDGPLAVEEEGLASGLG